MKLAKATGSFCVRGHWTKISCLISLVENDLVPARYTSRDTIFRLISLVEYDLVPADIRHGTQYFV